MHAARGGGNFGRILVALVVIALLFGFSPISTRLLRLADGSFKPTHYTSLALADPSQVASGISPGSVVPLELTNHTGQITTYHWAATQNGVLISQGSRTMVNGLTAALKIPTQGARNGILTVALEHTRIFVTLRLTASVS
jgi:hypothetical protein